MKIGELEIGSYNNKRTSNYGTNSMFIKFDGTTLYFSYNLVIGVKSNKYNLNIVSENIWDDTIDKHINKLKDEGFNQLARDKFIKTVNKITIKTYME